jgi:hypothetical protein
MYRHLLLTAALILGPVAAPAAADEDLVVVNKGGQKPVFGVMSKPKMVKATYLGVTAQPISPALNSQLNLPKGLGLVVTHVVPEGPADKAGLQRHDVLHKLGDQLLVNFEQFAVLIRLHETGEQATLSVIRGGEPIEITATLDEHEVPEFSMQKHGPWGGWNQTSPFIGDLGGQPMIDIRKIEHDIQQSVSNPMFMPKGASPLTAGNRFKLRVVDGEHTMHIYSDGQDQMQLKVEDGQGEVIYDGPWDPEADPAQTGLPEEVIEKVRATLESPDFGDPLRIEAEEIDIFSAPPAEDPFDGI